MPYRYYKKLSKTQKRIYNASCLASQLVLPSAEKFQKVLLDLKEALVKEDRAAIETAVARLVRGFSIVFNVPGAHAHVLEVRPVNHRGELHGLYERGGGLPHPRIKLWMRTAKKTQVVAFKTFLRTLVHEILHHLDYTYYRFPDSFHTEGFYQRESHLMRQLIGDIFEQASSKQDDKS